MRRIVGIGLGLALIGMAGKSLAASYADLLARADAAMKMAADAHKTLAPAPQPAKPYAPTDAEKARGFVVALPPIAEPFADRPPDADEVRDAVAVTVAPGETESFLLAVHALAPQQGLAWSTEGPSPSGIRLDFLPVVLAPLADRRGDSFRVVGLWLADGGAVDVPAGHTRAWLVRVTAAPDVRPGDYSLQPALVPAAGQAARVGPTVRIRVLPFTLADPWERKYAFGVFCGGADFTDAQYREMKAHGLDAILWFWGHYGLDIRNEGGKVAVGFADLDTTVARFQEAGMRGPLVLALGNDSCGHFERAVCQAFNLPMQPQVKRDGKEVKAAVLDNPKLEELMVDALKQLFDHAKAQKWPEIVILPYDEPTERMMDEHRRMVRLFRKNFPGVRLYGVTMDRLKWAEMVSDTDILVSNGDWTRIRQFATEKGKAAWFYGGVTTSMGYAGCRWRYGLRPYAYGPDGMWFWCYNFYVGDPWNEFDGFTPDSSWVIAWPPLAKGEHSVETLAYEGLREAIDDVRYAMTLEAKLAESKSGEVRAAYADWLKGLQRTNPKPEDLAGLRAQLIAWILALQ